MPEHYLHRLFNPRAVAVYGASDRPGAPGREIYANLKAAGFGGRLYPINPNRDTVAGDPALKSAGEADGPIDLAVVATGAAALPAIVADGAEHGIRHAVILSWLYQRAGEPGGRAVSDALAAARASGTRFLGPRCLGIQRPAQRLNASLAAAAAPGRMALITQSRALAAGVLDWAAANDIGFSAVISAGPHDDIELGEILDFLLTDGRTDSILLYLENVRDARRFMSGLRAVARSKPVIVMKAGRSAQAASVPAPPGGLPVAADDVFEAAIARAGAVRVRSFQQLFAAARALSSRLRPRGDRLGVLSNGRGPGLMATDLLVDRGYPVPDWAEDTRASLEAFLPEMAGIGNPVDLLGDTDTRRYDRALETALADTETDAVLALLAPQYLVDPDAVAEAAIERARATRKPLLTCWLGGDRVASARERLRDAGIPTHRTPEAAVDAFAFMATHHRNHQLLLQVPEPLSDQPQPDLGAAAAEVRSALAEDRTVLDAAASKRLLGAFHVPSTESVLAADADAAVEAAGYLGYPVAVKISSPDIGDKTGVGGVRLNVTDPAGLRDAVREVREAVAANVPDARVDGVIVEEMWSRRHGRELLLEVVPDPVFGPVIAFGLGGLMADALGDRALALPPLNAFLARRLIGSTRVARMLGAFHNLPPANLDVLETMLLRVSEMICELPWIRSLVINPLILDEQGALAVDARVRLQPDPPRPERYGHMAIHPYPARLADDWTARDGSRVHIRAIRPEDAHMERRFVQRLSERSRLMRFMSAVRDLTPEMMSRFTQIDYDRELALVALVDDAEVGVARYAANPDERSCEFAVVVADDWQGRGLGGELMRRIIKLAADRGFERMEGITLRENAAMQRLAGQLGFTVRPDPEDPQVYLLEKSLVLPEGGSRSS